MTDIEEALYEYDFPTRYLDYIRERIINDGERLKALREAAISEAEVRWVSSFIREVVENGMETLEREAAQKPSKARRGTWANMTDEEVHAEMKRRSVKRLATIAAKKAAGR